MITMRITFALFSLVGLTACATSVYKDHGKSLALIEMVNTEWGIGWTDEKKLITVETTYPLRVSTYSYPFFIHHQFIEQLSERKKQLEGLCNRQAGIFTAAPPKPESSYTNPDQRIFQNLNNSISDTVTTNQQGLQVTIDSFERSKNSETIKKILSAHQNVPDSITQDAIKYANSQNWLGIFSCKSKKENWVTSINFLRWTESKEKSLTYRNITLSTRITKLI